MSLFIMLNIVATPIGNLKDITYRAIEILKESDYILSEDTRRTGKLLKHYEIENKLISYNDFNKEKKTSHIIKDLKEGKNLSLVTDAGTPGISDPGFYIVRECIKNNIQVTSIPGACAAITAIVASGLPTDKFTFYGFLPKTSGKFEQIINEIKEREETAIIYESPHRIDKTLNRLSKLIPDAKIVIARELTKKFEEFIRGTPQQIIEQTKNRTIKGEIVLLINP